MQTNLTYVFLESELQAPPTWVPSRQQTGETREFLQRVIDAGAANVVVLDERGTALHVSNAWRIFAGKIGFPSASSLYGLEALHSCTKTAKINDGFVHDVQKIFKGLDAEMQKEYVMKCVPSPKWFLVRAAKLVIPRVPGFKILVTLEDITRQKLAEDELRNLGGRLIKAQEEERSRVGRDLHDDLSQRLAVFTMELEQLGQEMPEARNDLTAAVQNLMNKAQELASDVHRLSYQLHPFKLDTLGLSAAIQSLCNEVSEHRDLKVKFQQKGFPATISPDITLCIFRIAQEALHNIVKHSGAREARIALTKTAEAIRFRIVDRGLGFDIESAKAKKRLGLLSMRERLRLVGGEISIRSRPSEGTQIDVLIPL